MTTLTASPRFDARHVLANPPWTAIVGISGALVDLGVAAAYWAPHHVAAIRIPQSIAAWFIGEAAFSGGAASALFGLLAYCGLVCAVCALYRVAARRYAVLLRYPFACGALYGVLAYAVLFWIVAPLLTGSGGSTKPEWIGLCVATYILAIGIPCAFAARAVARVPSRA